ncbi:hypothetical protein XA68_14553 [Ophiocordyceps unilateralis]|uniref:Uncharacterized protein n=1 Tax=Ophiocordyceps unilateralis TaxID=268505 RepID=A0A2A9P8R0_OPHUN|nr:hypothetical protein XA68_14553 [Ophiocordyceps unilateralis]
MAEDKDSEVLATIAAGGTPDRASWPGLRAEIVARLDKIAVSVFPIPKLSPSRSRLSSSSCSSPRAHDASSVTLDAETAENRAESTVESSDQQQQQAVTLPRQIAPSRRAGAQARRSLSRAGFVSARCRSCRSCDFGHGHLSASARCAGLDRFA